MNSSCTAKSTLVRSVPSLVSAFTTPTSLTARWFTLPTGVNLNRHSTGLNACWPENRSKLIARSSAKKCCSPSPKKLSGTPPPEGEPEMPEGVGTFRAS
jgi:hypothetical protein